MRDLDDIIGNDLLELPIRGKTYRIPPMGYQDGLRLKMAAEAPEGADGPSNEEMLRLPLGPVLDEMRADNVPEAWILRAALTATAEAMAGRKVAELTWENGPDPEALAAQVAAMTGGQATNRATRRAAASTTRKRASGTGTTTGREISQPKITSTGQRSSRRGR